MIARIAALVGITIAYWFCAFTVLGGLMMGDCFENQACRDSKNRMFENITIISVCLYLAIIVVAAWVLFRRPRIGPGASGEMSIVRTFVSPDGKRRLRVLQRANGFFAFVEEFEDSEDVSEHGTGIIRPFWSIAYASGLYESAEAAEREARAVTPWLRENSA